MGKKKGKKSGGGPSGDSQGGQGDAPGPSQQQAKKAGPSGGPQKGQGDAPGPSQQQGKKGGPQGGQGDGRRPSQSAEVGQGDRPGQPQARGPQQKTGQQGQGDGRGQQQQPRQPGGPGGSQQPAQQQPPAGMPRQGQDYGRGTPPQGRGGGPPPRQQLAPFGQAPPGWGPPPGVQQFGQQRGGPPMQQQGGPPPGMAQYPQGPPGQQIGGPPQWQQGGPPPGHGAPVQGQPQGWGRPPQGPQGGPPPGLPQQQAQGPPRGGPPMMQQGGPPPGMAQYPQGPPQWQQGGPPQARPPQQQAQGAPRGGPPPGSYQQQQGQQQQRGQQQRGPQQRGPKQAQQRGPPPTMAQQPQEQQRQQGGPPPQQKGDRGPQPPAQREAVSSAGDTASAVVPKMSEMALTRTGDENLVSKIRQRPGKAGRIIKVESNHLQLNLGSLRTVYHYDLLIIPDTPKKFMRPVMEEFRKQKFPGVFPAFDGRKNWYTTKPLTNNLSDVIETVIVINDEDNREKKFKVTARFANEVDMTPLHDFLKSPVTPQEALQVVDIVLRMAPVSTCYPVGRSFFMKPRDMMDLGEGMEMYQGFYQSAVRGWRPLLNVDVAHKAFPQNICAVDSLCQTLSSHRQEVRREDLQRGLAPWQFEIFLKFIRTLRVAYEIPGQPGSKRHYRVNGLGDPCSKASFEHDGQRMTVQAYFGNVKRYPIKYPNLPTLWVGSPQRSDKILLPMELCWVVEGQGVNRKMTENQTSKMIRYAATNTDVRKQKIVQGIRAANYNSHPCVKEFGFSVGNEFQKLDARVLQPPDIKYAKRTIRVSKGVWRSDQFVTPVTINSWTMMSVCPRYPPRPDDFRRMGEMFERSARDVGMVFASRATEPFINIEARRGYADVEQHFKSLKNKFDVVFVVVPDSGPQYSFVKKAAELVVGCLTQCAKQTTVSRKMNGQTAANILLKVNSKLNGTNHNFIPACNLPILQRNVMIMGADVTHPGPEAQNIPSVAAVTASHDKAAFQYNICWRLQSPKVEIIGDLEEITIEHLKFYYKKTNCKPDTIIFFRDGVSEGQFEQVKNAEIRAIRSACKKLQQDGYEPKITFLVVQKRHHTRLFPMNERDSEDRNKNVPAGTCVDTDITHPFLQDFYLVSHASIQGVAKPTKYCTLWDDNGMDNDTVEQLTYYLCHMFSRCTRSVSYPAPTYYAHLAAARAKVYIENDRLNMDSLKEESRKYEIKTEIRKDLPMFFV